MPFPAAWEPLHNVGSPGGKGSDIAPLSNPKIGCPIRSREPVRRAIGDKAFFKLQRRYVRKLSQEITPLPAIEPAVGYNSRQRPVSSRQDIATVSFGKETGSIAVISSTVQPRTESYRKGMETDEKTVYS